MKYLFLKTFIFIPFLFLACGKKNNDKNVNSGFGEKPTQENTPDTDKKISLRFINHNKAKKKFSFVNTNTQSEMCSILKPSNKPNSKQEFTLFAENDPNSLKIQTKKETLPGTIYTLLYKIILKGQLGEELFYEDTAPATVRNAEMQFSIDSQKSIYQAENCDLKVVRNAFFGKSKDDYGIRFSFYCKEMNDLFSNKKIFELQGEADCFVKIIP